MAKKVHSVPVNGQVPVRFDTLAHTRRQANHDTGWFHTNIYGISVRGKTLEQIFSIVSVWIQLRDSQKIWVQPSPGFGKNWGSLLVRFHILVRTSEQRHTVNSKYCCRLASYLHVSQYMTPKNFSQNKRFTWCLTSKATSPILMMLNEWNWSQYYQTLWCISRTRSHLRYPFLGPMWAKNMMPTTRFSLAIWD